MKWRRVAVPASTEAEAERNAARLFAQGAVAVERDGQGSVGHFIEGEDASAAAAALGTLAADEPAPAWAAEWLAGQRSALVSPRIFITSTAAPRPAPEGAARVLLEPSLAFGDGHHATTRLCLEALDGELQRRPRARVLDVGCGSGVLAIAALLLGADEAAAIDVDEIALGATRRNARRNGVDLQRLAVSRALPEACAFDLAMANVPEEVHRTLAPRIAPLLAPDALLCCSGYAKDRCAEVESIYAPTGLAALRQAFRGSWAMTVFTRASAFIRKPGSQE